MKITTKTIVGLFLLAGAVLQDPSIASTLAAIALTHPHIAVIAGVIVAISVALHNPKVEAALEGAAEEKEDK